MYVIGAKDGYIARVTRAPDNVIRYTIDGYSLYIVSP